MKRLWLVVLCLAVWGAPALAESPTRLAATPTPTPPPPSEGLTLTVSPLPINLTTKPGTTVTTQLRVRNSGLQTEVIKVNLMKFSAYGEEGKPLLQERGPGDTYFDWVTFSPTVFTAEPKVWKTITMTIKVPASAAFDYNYAVTFSRASESGGQGNNHVAVNGAAATLVLLEALSPGAKRQLDIMGFTADHKVYEYLPTDFTIRLHNGGNVHVVPTGDIFITQGGREVAKVAVNAENGNVLPSSNRVFTASWADGFPVYKDETNGDQVVLDNHGQAIRQLTWDFTKVPRLRMGRYTARLVLAYNDGTRDVPVTAVLTFWVIPWRLLVILFLVMVFVGVGLWSTSRGAIRQLKGFGKRP